MKKSSWRRRIGVCSGVILTVLTILGVIFHEPLLTTYHLRMLHSRPDLFEKYFSADLASFESRTLSIYAETRAGRSRVYEAYLEFLRQAGAVVRNDGDWDADTVPNHELNQLTQTLDVAAISLSPEGDQLVCDFLYRSGVHERRELALRDRERGVRFARLLSVLLDSEHVLKKYDPLVARVRPASDAMSSRTRTSNRPLPFSEDHPVLLLIGIPRLELGLLLRLDDESKLIVQKIKIGSAAAASILKEGDRLLKVDDRIIDDFQSIQNALNDATLERPLRFEVDRDGRLLHIDVSPYARRD